MARKNKRERNFIVKLLENNGTMTTGAILEAINNKYAWGFTPYQLGNVLAKDERFQKQEEMATVASMRVAGETHYQALWSLR